MKSVRPPIAKLSAKAPTGITGFNEITGGGQTPAVLLALGLESCAT